MGSSPFVEELQSSLVTDCVLDTELVAEWVLSLNREGLILFEGFCSTAGLEPAAEDANIQDFVRLPRNNVLVVLVFANSRASLVPVFGLSGLMVAEVPACLVRAGLNTTTLRLMFLYHAWSSWSSAAVQ